MFKFFNNKSFLLCLIIAFGSYLRLFELINIPLTHDELSALYRLKFNSFSDLINYGVKVDGHPAGIHLFLYLWTNLFGTHDFMVKLPFVFMGISSIYLSYYLAKSWYNYKVGLLVSSYISTIQFTVLYSLIARPYISGLFLVLIMVIFWKKIVVDKNQKIVNYLLFIISASLCTYNHHFSMLFCVLVALTGVFIVDLSNRRNYWLSLVAIIILYLPHFSILYYQLFVSKGLKWLAEPNATFLAEHLKYILQYSYVSYLLIICLSILSVLNIKFYSIKKSLYVIPMLWFLLPIIIGVSYSIFISPVIQNSMLIFSLPFLFLFLFAGIKNIKQSYLFILILAVLSSNTYALINQRLSFEVLKKQPFSSFAQLINDFDELKTKKHAIIYDMNPNYVDFYLQRIDVDTRPISFFKNLTPQKLDSFLITNTDKEFLVCGNISRKNFPIIKEYFPFIVDKDYGFTYEHYIFSKDTTNQQIEEPFQNITLVFNDSHSQNHSVLNGQDLHHLSKEKLILPNKKTVLYESKLKDIVKDVHFFIDLYVEIQAQNNLNGYLISDIILNENTIKRYSLNLSKPTLKLNPSGLNSFFLPIRLTSADLDSKTLENLIIKISLVNKSESSIIVDNLQVETFEGNKFVSSLVKDF